ncbi:MAG: hypothetical protein M1827_000836 [Pycnora praestabilis]|nr:MAG: hypothetical protein M1827_000836 [Pycnora praestabilis]
MSSLFASLQKRNKTPWMASKGQMVEPMNGVGSSGKKKTWDSSRDPIQFASTCVGGVSSTDYRPNRSAEQNSQEETSKVTVWSLEGGGQMDHGNDPCVDRFNGNPNPAWMAEGGGDDQQRHNKIYVKGSYMLDTNTAQIQGDGGIHGSRQEATDDPLERVIIGDLYPSLRPAPSGGQEHDETETTQVPPEQGSSVEVEPETPKLAAHAALKYQIPEDVRREAMLASPATSAAHWQHTLYRGPEGEKVKVHYCRSKETTERISKLFLNEKVLGFDIEWKPQAQVIEGIKRNVSLIQLASEERIALFHVALFGKGSAIEDFVAPTLKQIMESANITKVGVSVKSDCTRLRKFMKIESQGLLELSHLYKVVRFSISDVSKIDKRLVSLAQQVEEHLKLPLYKGSVRSSDWSEALDMQQILYAASDSYAGLRVYDILEEKRKLLKPMPPCPAHAELNLPLRTADGLCIATADELQGSDETEAVVDGKSNVTSNNLPEVEEMARDFLELRIEDKAAEGIDSIAKSTNIQATKSPEIVEAEAWVAQWRSIPSEATQRKSNATRATPAYLRAYSLWHHQGHDVKGIAQLLRDPPLQVSTVTGYILEAIRIEKLPYDKTRVKEVVAQLPETTPEHRTRAFQRLLG